MRGRIRCRRRASRRRSARADAASRLPGFRQSVPISSLSARSSRARTTGFCWTCGRWGRCALAGLRGAGVGNARPARPAASGPVQSRTLATSWRPWCGGGGDAFPQPCRGVWPAPGRGAEPWNACFMDLPVHELGDKALRALSEPYSWIRTIEEWAASVPDPRPATTYGAWAEHFKTVKVDA